MPKLGVDMQEGEIIEWKKQEGDVVNEGDILLEIMSDKTNTGCPLSRSVPA